ncbi:MAG: Inositol-1-monophosphatase [Phycisphaerae bacterium]|nr:Inositol-1-monophosphatase [Phycisphaerae bacterium]
MNAKPLDLSTVCRQTREWCSQVSGIALKYYRNAPEYRRKHDDSVVTAADLEIQEWLLQTIHTTFPEHAALAEEQTPLLEDLRPVANQRYCWVIDPVDGTRNFFRGIPCFCISIGLLDRGHPVMGVIHDPLIGQAYYGWQGGGAWLGDDRLEVNSADWNFDSLVGIPTGRREMLPQIIYTEWLKLAVLRNHGSSALHLAYVAAGALDGCYAKKTRLWDIAAGALLVWEAGGSCTGPLGELLFPIQPEKYQGEKMAHLAGGPTIHQNLLTSLRG